MNIMNNHPLELLFNCFHQKRLIIRETTRIIGYHCYSRIKSCIRSVVFPPSVEVIGSYAFYRCTSLQYVSFKGKSRLKVIGNRSFYESSLIKITFPSSVELIGFSSFENCKSLKLINFSTGKILKKIGYSAFAYSGVQNVLFPSSIEEIGRKAFYGCNDLETISFPDDSRLKKVCFNAFGDCKNLVSARFPGNSKLIKTGCFTLSND